jgi:hypothetical protein
MPTWADLYGEEYNIEPDVDEFTEEVLDNKPIAPDQIQKNNDSIFGKIIDGKLIEPLKQPKEAAQELRTTEKEAKEKLTVQTKEKVNKNSNNRIQAKRKASKRINNFSLGSRPIKNSNEI